MRTPGTVTDLPSVSIPESEKYPGPMSATRIRHSFLATQFRFATCTYALLTFSKIDRFNLLSLKGQLLLGTPFTS